MGLNIVQGGNRSNTGKQVLES
ncbi:hypothetical protein VS_II0614 [Vibrio atlanticus]|uniref:Uncharacterized protein n=1 Tax=Vibrio atlanticus (strain LGP32) TaxID=575788 RepID=B7VRM6_VIBA3|nr:hypothetical protein VS_II0614 [Vibrio atlanticus]